MAPLSASIWKLLGVAAFAVSLSLAPAYATDTVTSPDGNVFKVIEGEAAAEGASDGAEPEGTEAATGEAAEEVPEAPSNLTPFEETLTPENDISADETEPAEIEEAAPAAEPETSATTGAIVSNDEPIIEGEGGRVQLTAVIARGAPPMADNISYTVERLEYGAPKEVVASETGPTADFELPNGRYRVRAAYREVVAEDEIVVNGDTEHEINLDAGFIILRMIPYVGGDPISNPIDWEVRSFAKNYKGERDLLQSRPAAATTTVVLPAGWYMVHAWENGELTKHAIEVTPGATVKYTLVKQ